jgi:16S rRNA (cytosine967-C5)-methyltransferase
VAKGAVSPGRMCAARVLLACERGRYADRELARRAPEDPADRALAWNLVMGVLRSRGALDAAIARGAKRPAEGLDPEVRAALRLGLYELHYARTPAHAAVDQAVRLVGALGAGRARGLVNAVLRRAKPPRSLPPTVNHPDWLVERWRARYGEAACDRWCARNDSAAPLSLVARDDGQALVAALREAGLDPRPGEAGGAPVPGCWLVDGWRGRLEGLPGFAEGGWWVMDPAAAAAADLLEVRPGERTLDACAAPGGKSLRLAAAGAAVTATDLSPERLERLAENAARTGLAVTWRALDWLTASDEEIDAALDTTLDAAAGEAPFDAVLVDAPCTGLGTLRRHPEIRWSRLPTDPAAMALRQLPLLERAATRVRPGGRLVYAVCSPEPEEGEAVARDFQEDNPHFELERVLALAPPTGDEDAFFAARFRRREEP